ncbi:hypothetical protein FOB58_005151 [Candida parapsilosis]|uniref:ATPase expression protein 1 n=2 Tax=Candida parapsilosis TaxID=5480 RepID=G8B5K9_CANPC|nr:uncharacterized protein CPAR2_603200 [Candida parapsilosis]KAF6043436.1 hypothetical protein FOB58_005151 [Candida parapsilosis]KAF6044067.1 hypothetical protein FOB59_005023 [Candida parapsilosis]KAF6045313.1 hypothetical protein FOB60_004885 [Candida parapsilosis]KAF6060100.1 hypothetical protein FOB61_005115 [Candida parapsilosis]KAI5901521.1 hypothetical protein K4G60_g658 [Candida parapsilosis]
MLTRRLIRQLPRRYTTISFTPNENKHVFESEKLSPKENFDAIPNQPDVSNIDKVHHEIINPEEVADLVTKLNTNDVLISILSRNKHLYGDEDYAIQSVKDQEVPPVVFPYSSILLSWKEIYNKQIKDLKDIEPVNEGYPKVDAKYLGLWKRTSLDEFFNKSRAIKNSTSIKKGTVQPSEIKGLFTVESASNVVLSTIDNLESLEEYLSFIISKVPLFTFQGAKELLTRVTLLSSEVGVSGSSLNQLACTVIDLHPRVLRTLQHDIKDRLAFAIIANNRELATRLIQELIDGSACPSQKTVDSFLETYKFQDPVTTLRELTFLKSVIHHRELSEHAFKLLIQTVRDVNELIKLVSLLKKTPNLLQEKQYELYAKLRQLTTSELVTTQFIRFLTKNGIKLNPLLKERVIKDYNRDPEVITALNKGI